jgi:hypothetical protein
MSGLGRRLPPIDSTGYHVPPGAIAILVLGPPGGFTTAYVGSSLGSFVGGRVLDGISGSVVTYSYGVEGKSGGGTVAGAVGGETTQCPAK